MPAFNLPTALTRCQTHPRSLSRACVSIGAQRTPIDFGQRPSGKVASRIELQLSCQTFLRILLTRNAVKTRIGVTGRVNRFDMPGHFATSVAEGRNRCCVIRAEESSSRLQRMPQPERGGAVNTCLNTAKRLQESSSPVTQRLPLHRRDQFASRRALRRESPRTACRF